eukprot:6470736-Amphidinium_carterae.1
MSTDTVEPRLRHARGSLQALSRLQYNCLVEVLHGLGFLRCKRVSQDPILETNQMSLRLIDLAPHAEGEPFQVSSEGEYTSNNKLWLVMRGNI